MCAIVLVMVIEPPDVCNKYIHIYNTTDITQYVSTEISLDVTVEDTQMEVEPTIWLQHSLNTQPDAVICDDDICQDRLTNRRQNERSILHPDDVHLRSGQSPGLAIESQPFTRDGWAQTDSSKIIKQSVKVTIGQNTSLKENLPAVVKLEKIPVPVSSGSVLVSRPLKGASLYCWSFSKPGPTKEVASTPNHNFDQDISSPNGFQEETQSTTFEDTGECLPPTSNDQFSAQKAASAVAQGPEKVCSALFFFLFHKSVDAFSNLPSFFFILVFRYHMKLYIPKLFVQRPARVKRETQRLYWPHFRVTCKGTFKPEEPKRHHKLCHVTNRTIKDHSSIQKVRQNQLPSPLQRYPVKRKVQVPQLPEGLENQNKVPH